jgi:8-amino-7-oxononanoate synthase
VTSEKFPGSFFGPSTLVALLRHRAEHQGDDPAFIFLGDGETRQRHLSYAELDRQARAIAARLQELNLPGERVLLLYPPGLEFIAALFGCLYAGVVAVPGYPPRMNRSLHRIRAILRDADTRVALSTRAVRHRVKPLAARAPGLRSLRWLATDTLRDGVERGWREPDVGSSTLAVLQYTSGSTGTPKGVMLTHANLLHNSALIAHAFEHTRSGTGVFWLPNYHDMGLIGGVLQPLYVGRPNVLMSPMAFLQRPARWLRAISRYRATTSGGPNFAYDLCVRKITPREREGLDLSSWRVAFSGAETVRAETLEAFAETFGPCGFRREAFYPCYGLAEATLLATGGFVAAPPIVCCVDSRELEKHIAVEVSPDAAGSRRVVGCGRSLRDQDVVIVHPKQRVACGEGQVGEIWLRGPSVAQGYWQRSSDTRRTFRAHLADSREGPFLRTGDLGFLRKGDLFVTGRLKDLIIVRGQNHYPEDIERTVQSCHPALRPAAGAAFAVDTEAGQRLVVVQEIERRGAANSAVAIDAIRRAVDIEHGLIVGNVVLIRAGSIPKTSSGKIQRHSCRRAFLAGTLTEVGRWSDGQDEETERAHTNGHAASPPTATRRRLDRGHEPVLRAPSPLGTTAAAMRDRTAELVLAEVRRIAHHRAHQVRWDSTLGEIGLDSLQRVELQAALEARCGGHIPEHIAPELQTLRDVVTAARQYLGAPRNGRQHVEFAQIPPEHYQVEHFPECVALGRQATLLQAGLENPYFQPQEHLPGGSVRIDGRELLNFASYDYLGLAHDPRVTAAAQEAIERCGTSVSGSRLVCGQRDVHRELEQELADWLGAEAAVAFVSGHATNATTIGHLLSPSDLVVHDALAHNSILQGCRLSGARRMAFAHNDADALDRLLHEVRGQYRRVLVAIEGVYSMDGDVPDLPRFTEVKRRHKALLLVDEAHSLGVLGETGRGIGEHFGVAAADVDLWMGTLSKSLASCGGYIAGSLALVQYLKYTAPGFVYSVGMTPANAAAALASLRVLRAEPVRVQSLRCLADVFLRRAKLRGLNTGACGGTAVVPVIVGDARQCLRLWQAIFARGLSAQPILPPAVPEDGARLRFFITQQHSEAQIHRAVDIVAEELSRLAATPMTKPLEPAPYHRAVG